MKNWKKAIAICASAAALASMAMALLVLHQLVKKH